MKRTLMALCLVLVTLAAGGQNFQRFNFGNEDIFRFNPAAGVTDGNRAYIFSKYNFTDSYLNKERPLDLVVGTVVKGHWGAVAAELGADGYSFFSRHSVQLNYSYAWTLPNQGRIAAGGGLYLGIDNVDFTALQVQHGPGEKAMYCSPDFGLGVEYARGPFRVGFAAMNILATEVLVDGAALLRNPRVMLAHFSYEWRFFKDDCFGVNPYAVVGYCERASVELGLKLDWKRFAALSYSFRAMEMSHICHLGVRIPRSPVIFNLAYTSAAFCSEDAVSAGLTVKF